MADSAQRHGFPFRLPAPLVAGVGVFLLVGTIMLTALAHLPFSPLLIVLATLGGALQLAAPFLDRPTRPTAAAKAPALADGRLPR